MVSTDEAERTQRYTRALMVALRARHVSSERIGEVVADVESRVAETGEDPREAFGPPQRYAAAVAGRRVAEDSSTWVAIALGGASGWMLAHVAFAIVNREPEVYGQSTWLAVLEALALAAGAAIAAHRLYRPVVDPRTGSRRLTGGGWPTSAVLVAGTALVVVLAVLVRVLT